MRWCSGIGYYQFLWNFSIMRDPFPQHCLLQVFKIIRDREQWGHHGLWGTFQIWRKISKFCLLLKWYIGIIGHFVLTTYIDDAYIIKLEIKYYVTGYRRKAMAPHSSTLAWKIPWMEEPGRVQPMGSLRVRHDGETSFMCAAKCKSFVRCSYENKLITSLINRLINIQKTLLLFAFRWWTGNPILPLGNVNLYSFQFHVQSFMESLSKSFGGIRSRAGP